MVPVSCIIVAQWRVVGKQAVNLWSHRKVIGATILLVLFVVGLDVRVFVQNSKLNATVLRTVCL